MRLSVDSLAVAGTASGDRRAWRGRHVVLALVVLLACASCLNRYVLPTGDGESKHSPHAVQGRITAIDADQLTVLSDGGETLMIAVDPETKFYKAVGGVVLRPELMTGHRVRIWFHSQKAAEGASRGPAAVVELASLDPADDWPK
jgi:hypothetical protein